MLSTSPARTHAVRSPPNLSPVGERVEPGFSFGRGLDLPNRTDARWLDLFPAPMLDTGPNIPGACSLMDRGVRPVLVAADLSPIAGSLLSTAVQVGCRDGVIVGHADMIIMGTHGRTGIRRAIMGSVAEDVLPHAHRPVLVILRGVPEAVRPPERVAL
jgi:hypothetical protein